MPLARTADLFLPVRPGTDSALFGAVLHELIRNDWLDHEFIDAHTNDFDEAAAAVADMTPAWAADDHRRARRRASSRPPNGGGPRRPGCCCTPVASSSSPRASTTCWRRSTSAWPPASSASPDAGVSTITGQGNGQGGREHGHKCDQLPGNRDITNPEHRAHVAAVWGCDESRDPRQGHHRRRRSSRRSTTGEIKGLLSICFNPVVSSPDANFTARGARQARVLLASSTSSSPSPAQHADVVLPGSLHEEDEGTSTTGEGRIIKINAAVDPPGEARVDWEILIDLAERLGKRPVLPVRPTPSRSSRSSAWRRPAAPPTTGVPRGSASRTRWGCSGRSPRSATPARRGCTRAASSSTPTARPGSTASRTGRRPRSSTTSTRSGSPPAGSSASTCPAPRPGASPRSSTSTPSRCARCTPSSPSDSASPTATSSPSPHGAARSPCRPTWWPRSGPTPCSSRTTGPARKAANQLTNRALDPISKMPEFKVAAVRVERRWQPTTDDRTRPARSRARVTASTTRPSSSSTRAAASAARPACRPAWSAAPTGASR